MQENRFKEWNQQGFIPGPEESEDAFMERILFCKKLKQTLSEQQEKEFPFSQEEMGNESLLEDAWPVTKKLYGIAPDWVPVFFSNNKLAPWHGGCAWIFQLEDQAHTAAFLQLRKSFQKSAVYLGFYERKEIFAHEMAHIGRMSYEEPQFEEIFAYQSSSSYWRKGLGPIFQSEKEMLVFTFTLFLPLIPSIMGTLELAYLLFSLPFIFLFFSLGRLWSRYRILKRCQKQLEPLLPNPYLVSHLLYRLRDREIHEFSALPPEKIKKWIHTQSLYSFRWIFLKTLYDL